jgi:hypothetical protein
VGGIVGVCDCSVIVVGGVLVSVSRGVMMVWCMEGGLEGDGCLGHDCMMVASSLRAWSMVPSTARP